MYAIEVFQISCVPVLDKGIESLTLQCHITIYKHDGTQGRKSVDNIVILLYTGF